MIDFRTTRLGKFTIRYVVRLRRANDTIQLTRVHFRRAMYLGITTMFFLLPKYRATTRPIRSLFFRYVTNGLLRLRRLRISKYRVNTTLQFSIRRTNRVRRRRDLPRKHTTSTRLFDRLPIVRQVAKLRLRHGSPTTSHLMYHFTHARW